MDDEPFVISGDQISDYVVCPEAWRLKYIVGEENPRDGRSEEGILKRKEWVEKHDNISTFRNYARIVYLLLLAVVIIVFLLEHQRTTRSHSNFEVRGSISK
jgi:hypothetical protein